MLLAPELTPMTNIACPGFHFWHIPSYQEVTSASSWEVSNIHLIFLTRGNKSWSLGVQSDDRRAHIQINTGHFYVQIHALFIALYLFTRNLEVQLVYKLCREKGGNRMILKTLGRFTFMPKARPLWTCLPHCHFPTMIFLSLYIHFHKVVYP